jgi:hypothetical protein
MQSASGGSRGQWEDYVEQARAKLPEPPPNVQDIYVKWVPWLGIIWGIFGLIFAVLFGLLGAILAPFLVFAGAEGLRAGMSGIFALVLWGVASAFSLVGGLKMKQMNATGWWLFAVCLIVTAVSDLIPFNPIGLVITLAFAWIHVHVRPRYI